MIKYINRTKPTYNFVPIDPDFTLRLKDVVKITGVGHWNIRTLQRDGKFPMHKQYTYSHVGFNPDHIEAWLRCRALGIEWIKTPDQT